MKNITLEEISLHFLPGYTGAHYRCSSPSYEWVTVGEKSNTG